MNQALSKKNLVGIYVRVSTEEQAREGISIDAQAEKCENYCKARGWDVYKLYKDPGYSAGTMERPALKELLQDARAGKFNIILVYKIDRFSRRLKDLIMSLEELKQENINFTSVTEQIDTTSAMGEAFFQIIGVFAQLERGMVKERVKMAFDRKAGVGEAFYRPPYGYTYQNKRLVPDTETSEKVREIFEMYMSGVAVSVIAEKYSLSVASVYNIIKNPVYIGKIRYKGELYKGTHKAIISEELWEKANNTDG